MKESPKDICHLVIFVDKAIQCQTLTRLHHKTKLVNPQCKHQIICILHFNPNIINQLNGFTHLHCFDIWIQIWSSKLQRRLRDHCASMLCIVFLPLLKGVPPKIPPSFFRTHLLSKHWTASLPALLLPLGFLFGLRTFRLIASLVTAFSGAPGLSWLAGRRGGPGWFRYHRQFFG